MNRIPLHHLSLQSMLPRQATQMANSIIRRSSYPEGVTGLILMPYLPSLDLVFARLTPAEQQAMMQYIAHNQGCLACCMTLGMSLCGQHQYSGHILCHTAGIEYLLFGFTARWNEKNNEAFMQEFTLISSTEMYPVMCDLVLKSCGRFGTSVWQKHEVVDMVEQELAKFKSKLQ